MQFSVCPEYQNLLDGPLTAFVQGLYNEAVSVLLGNHYVRRTTSTLLRFSPFWLISHDTPGISVCFYSSGMKGGSYSNPSISD